MYRYLTYYLVPTYIGSTMAIISVWVKSRGVIGNFFNFRKLFGDFSADSRFWEFYIISFGEMFYWLKIINISTVYLVVAVQLLFVYFDNSLRAVTTTSLNDFISWIFLFCNLRHLNRMLIIVYNVRISLS